MGAERDRGLLQSLQQGGGLIEVLIAVLIFSTGMMGLVSTQLAAKKAGYEALQRSLATALARDILERMRANPGQLSSYVKSNLGDRDKPLPAPAIKCTNADCQPFEMALFDLWQWESLLLGASEKQSDNDRGVLVSPRACILHESGSVSVEISWRGFTSSSNPSGAACGSDIAGLYDDPAEAAGNNLRRRLVAMTTYVGGI